MSKSIYIRVVDFYGKLHKYRITGEGKALHVSPLRIGKKQEINVRYANKDRFFSLIHDYRKESSEHYFSDDGFHEKNIQEILSYDKQPNLEKIMIHVVSLPKSAIFVLGAVTSINKEDDFKQADDLNRLIDKSNSLAPLPKELILAEDLNGDEVNTIPDGVDLNRPPKLSSDEQILNDDDNTSHFEELISLSDKGGIYLLDNGCIVALYKDEGSSYRRDWIGNTWWSNGDPTEEENPKVIRHLGDLPKIA